MAALEKIDQVVRAGDDDIAVPYGEQQPVQAGTTIEGFALFDLLNPHQTIVLHEEVPHVPQRQQDKETQVTVVDTPTD